MARGPGTFKQRDVTRALLATKAAGVEIARIEIDQTGKIILVTGTSGEASAARSSKDELDKELEDFEARHGEG